MFTLTKQIVITSNVGIKIKINYSSNSPEISSMMSRIAGGDQTGLQKKLIGNWGVLTLTTTL